MFYHCPLGSVLFPVLWILTPRTTTSASPTCQSLRPPKSCHIQGPRSSLPPYINRALQLCKAVQKQRGTSLTIKEKKKKEEDRYGTAVMIKESDKGQKWEETARKETICNSLFLCFPFYASIFQSHLFLLFLFHDILFPALCIKVNSSVHQSNINKVKYSYHRNSHSCSSLKPDHSL